MHGQWLRDPVTFMPRRCQRPERKLALHRFLHTLLSKKSNNFSKRLLYSSIFSARGEGAVEYFEFGVYPRVTNTYMYMCQRYPVYTHVREFLATKDITIGVLLCQDKGVGSRMPIIGPVD